MLGDTMHLEILIRAGVVALAIVLAGCSGGGLSGGSGTVGVDGGGIGIGFCADAGAGQAFTRADVNLVLGQAQDQALDRGVNAVVDRVGNVL